MVAEVSGEAEAARLSPPLLELSGSSSSWLTLAVTEKRVTLGAAAASPDLAGELMAVATSLILHQEDNNNV